MLRGEPPDDPDDPDGGVVFGPDRGRSASRMTSSAMGRAESKINARAGAAARPKKASLVALQTWVASVS